MPTDDYRKYDTVLRPERHHLDFLPFYEDVHAKTVAMRQSVPHVSNVPYGPDPKQKLDVYHPAGALKGARVLLHIHGGGFVEGDRIDYGFVAAEHVARGSIVVVPSYRLCSDGHSMLDAVADTKAAVLWVREHIADYGGNAESIVLSGHSAGAITSSNAVADLAWLEEAGVPKSFIDVAVLVSGVYNFPLDFNARNDILTSPEVKIAMSAMQKIRSLPTKLVLAVGSVETGPKDDYVASAKAFHQAVEVFGGDVELIVLPGLNHLDTARVVGDPASPVFQAIRSFLD